MMEIHGRTIFFILLSLLILPCPGKAIAGPYLNSVHGNNTIDHRGQQIQYGRSGICQG